MSRKIEYRVWDKKNKAIRPVYSISNLNEKDDCAFKYVVSNCNNKLVAIIEWQDCVLLQYTGLKDMNGTKIFEGYIVVANLCDDVQQKEMVYFKVVFDDFSFCLIDKKGIKFPLSGFDCIEVVGNIYENKELLK